jgi:predicted nuclease with TOPRIM domain
MSEFQAAVNKELFLELEEKDAEIERLKAKLKAREAVSRLQDERERAKDAEIERLRAENETLHAANASFEGGMHWRNGIITELVAAIVDLQHPYAEHAYDDLIQRAREASK